MRLCSGAGCGRAIEEDKRYCAECFDEHRTPQQEDGEKQHTTSYDAVLDGLRKGTRWQRTRERAIRKCPFCARCQVVLSEIVDHIIPAAVVIVQAQLSGHYPFDKYAGYYLMSNLQGLCRPCHYTKTMEDKGHVGPWPDAVEKERAQPKRVYSF